MQTETLLPPAAQDAPSALARMCAGIEFAIGRIVETLAGLLVLVETLVLFVGVFSRYVLRNPFVWSDELASILFLWLAMLGAVVAYRRSEHMRMSALFARMGARGRMFFEALALVVGLVFVAGVLQPALDYALEEMAITTPALEISNAWRAAALPIGLTLILVIGLLRIGRLYRLVDVAMACALVALIGAALWLAHPALIAMGNYKLVLFFVVIAGGAVLAGIPIVFAFGIGTFAFIAFTTHTPWSVIVSRMDEGMSHIILLSVPLFVFLGLLIEVTGMARAMVAFLASLIGHLRGGLSYVLLGAMYLVSGISGSKAADMAAVAPILFPEMKERGERGGNLVALLSASGAMSETIPPSLVLITIGSVTGVSISALFTGGLLPGLVLAVALAAVVARQARRENRPTAPRAPGREILRLSYAAIPGIALPFLIRAAVVEGVATATEVSTIGIVYAAVVALIGAAFFKQKIEWRRLWPMLVDTANLSGAILIIIGAATAMAWALTQSGFSRDLAATMAHVPGGAAGFMAISIVAFVVLGSILEGIPAIVLFGPLLFPIARTLHIHEVHYAMVVILAMGIGLFAPPFGVGYYAACAIGRVDPAEGVKPIWPYLLALLIGLVVIAAVPWISIGFL
ncbi:MAG: TRAP transporter large permease subunit [Hyphomicrobiales bacterium]|nr:TRAP transporter large permease subunit [Hyphomicrobiales bacterium]